MSVRAVRTPTEVVARYETVKEDDYFGFKAEVLLSHLPKTFLKPYLKPDADTSDLDSYSRDLKSVTKEAVEYMEFAWGKALDHRGISANRSIDKLTELFWLMGRDDVVAAMYRADYHNYGAPKLKAACELMGWPIPASKRLTRMAQGLQCRDRDDIYEQCDEGCSY